MPPPPFTTKITSHTITQVVDGSGVFEGAIEGPNGDGSWLFAVPDGETAADSTLMLSIASANALFLGRLDLSSVGYTSFGGTPQGSFTSATANLLWAKVNLDDYGGLITDHWHSLPTGRTGWRLP